MKKEMPRVFKRSVL